MLRRAGNLAIRFGDGPASDLALALVRDPAGAAEDRRAALAALAAVGHRDLPATLREVLADDPAAPFAADLIRGLAGTGDAATVTLLRDLYDDLAPGARRSALAALAARPASAGVLLDALEAGEISTADLTGDLARQIRNLGDDRLTARLTDVWGAVAETDEDRRRQIEAVRRKLSSQDNAVSARPDLAGGRELFKKTCGQCHELFGEGGNVGPGLTGSNRKDLDYLLTNILDPSAVMAKDYRPTVLLTDDGRVLTGLVRSETAAAVVLATADGDVTVPAASVLERSESDKSMMPDGLLNPLSTEQVRDLVGYLRSDGR